MSNLGKHTSQCWKYSLVLVIVFLSGEMPVAEARENVSEAEAVQALVEADWAPSSAGKTERQISLPPSGKHTNAPGSF